MGGQPISSYKVASMFPEFIVVFVFHAVFKRLYTCSMLEYQLLLKYNNIFGCWNYLISLMVPLWF